VPGGVALPGVLFGRDLFRWGNFEDYGADTERRGGHHWETNLTFKRIEVLQDGPTGGRDLRLIEWRKADDLPDSFYGFDTVRARDEGVEPVPPGRRGDRSTRRIAAS